MNQLTATSSKGIKNSLMSKIKQSLFLKMPVAIVLLLSLVLLACSSGGLLPVGKPAKGETLIITVEDIKRVQEVRFQGRDENHYLLAPASRDNEFVVMRLAVHNADATRVPFTVDERAMELRGLEETETYAPLDLYLTPDKLLEKGVKSVESGHPSEDLYVPFLGGPVVLEQGFTLIGWSVFEVPKGTKLREMRWGAGDVVFIRS